MLAELRSDSIIKSHKSYIINTRFIETIEKVYQKLWDIHFYGIEDTAQLSSNYRDDVLKKWEA